MIHNPIIQIIILSLVSFFATYLYRKWAIKNSILDLPNERSSHLVPTPRGGGIAIIVSWYAGLFFLYFCGDCEELDHKLLLALLPGLVLGIIGYIDDFKDLSPLLRVCIQLICSIFSLYFLGGFHPLFGTNLTWLWNALALLGIIWFINLFNFLDGSDGYASMETISVSLAMYFFTRSYILLVLVFIVAGFLYWNWPRAKIFLGDVGSTTLGFILIIFGIFYHNSGELKFEFWMVITALFWFDATITLIRRMYNREKVSRAHKKHLYQRIIQGGFSHLQTLLAGLGINIILFIITYVIWKKYLPMLPGFLLALIVLLMAMRYVDKKFAFKKNHESS